jgi:hypothetical protein
MRYAAILITCACGSAPTSPASPEAPAAAPAQHSEIAYYEGTTTATSPDGSTPFGPPIPVIVRRTIDPAAKTIEEYVVNPGEEHPATMTQRAGDVFSVSDPKGEFTGTLTFAGPAWHYTSWTYDIKIGTTGSITGHGEVSAAALKTEKQFIDAGGTPRARMTDDLHAIDKATFERRLAELLPAK